MNSPTLAIRAEMRAKPLRMTGRQAEILTFIREHAAARGFPPTIREIGSRFGLRSINGIRQHLRALEHKGYLAIAPGQSRAMTVLAGEPFDTDAVGRLRSAISDVARIEAASIPEDHRAAVRSELAATRARIDDLIRWLSEGTS